MGGLRELTRGQRVLLLDMVAATGLVFSGLTGVAVALPALEVEFRASQDAAEWAISAAMLPLAALVLIGGRLGDLFGRRRWFAVGMAWFGLGSALCGLAPTMAAFLCGRVAQGIGTAVTVPLALANLTETLPPARRSWAVGVVASGTALVTAAAQVPMALLVQGAGWRWLFLASVPVTISIILVALRYGTETRGGGQSLDIRGALLLSAGLAALVLACQQAPYWGVASVSTVVMLVVAFHLLATFVLVELHCREPMVDLRSVKRAVVWGALVGVGTMECASVAISVFLMLYLQEVCNLSPLTASLILLPKGVGSILVSGLTGRLTDRGAGRWLIAGGLAGAVVTLMWLSWGAEHRQTVLLVPALFLFGLARALTTPAASTLPMSVLPHRVHGVAASLSVAARQLSGVVGLAVLSSLLAAVQWTNRNHLLHSGGYTARQQQAIDSLLFDHDHSPLLAAVPPALHPPIIAAADQAFISGLQAVLVATSALLLLIALVAAVVIPAPQTSP